MGMTVAIVVRMVYVRWRIRRVLGDTCTHPYVSVVAMTVESGLAYTIAMMLCTLPVGYTFGTAPVQVTVSVVLIHSASFLMNLIGDFGMLYRHSSGSWQCFDSICSPTRRRLDAGSCGAGLRAVKKVSTHSDLTHLNVKRHAVPGKMMRRWSTDRRLHGEHSLRIDSPVSR